MNNGNFLHISTLHLPTVTLPEQSVLYSLAPIGVGTTRVESLTSYMMRLAEAHAVWPSTLLRYLEFSARPDLADSVNTDYVMGSFFWGESRAVNGMNRLAMTWADRLTMHTSRAELSHLTMLKWQNVIDSSRLLHATRRWCPLCYREWSTTGQPLYEPLAWMLRPLKRCSDHGIVLRDRCPKCHHTLTVLGRTSRPGHCSRCDHWLADDAHLLNNVNEVPTEVEQWMTSGALRLLATTTGRDDVPLRGQSSRVLAFLVRQAGVTYTQLEQYMGLRQHFLFNHIPNQSSPGLETLLRMCFRLHIQPLDFLTWQEQEKEGETKLQACLAELCAINRRAQRPNDDWLREAFEREVAQVVDKNPPQSLQAIADKLGCTKYSLNKLDGKLCWRVERRYRRWQQQQLGEPTHKSPPHKLSTRQVANLQKRFKAILAREFIPPLTLRAVANQLGCTTSLLYGRFPNLSRQLTAKRRGWMDREQIQRVLEGYLRQPGKTPKLRFIARELHITVRRLRLAFPELCVQLCQRHLAVPDASDLERRLQCVLKEGVPRSLNAVSKQLSINRIILRKHAPELCRQIVERYRQHR